mgnify:CR=1 FL=1
MKNIAIFASGTGSNATKLIKHAQTLSHINPVCLITDNADAGIIEIANKLSFPIFIIEKGTKTKSVHEAEILKTLRQNHIEWIFLAGYMRILSANFLNEFYDQELKQCKVINIHPSMLPKHRGLNAYAHAFDSNEKESGISIHFVDAGMDTGKIIKQASFSKEAKDTIITFKARGLALEHILYPQVLSLLNKAIATNNYKDFA